MRVLSLSTHGIKCGIGDYNSDLKTAFEKLGHTYDVEVIDRSLPSTRKHQKYFRAFPGRLPEYDLAVIQHEFVFYGRSLRSANRNFAKLLRSLNGSKRVVVFMHTTFPKVRKPRWIQRWKDRRAEKQLVDAINHIPNVRIFVHGMNSRRGFETAGVLSEKITDIAFPMFSDLPITAPREIAPGEPVTLVMFGFIAAYKGYDTALNAMRLLPENVKLHIVGDRNPLSPNDLTLDAIHGFLETGQWHHAPKFPPLWDMTRVESESLKARVKMVGHVSIADLDAIMNAADIVLAPYTPDGPAGSSALGRALSFARPIIASGIPGFQDVQQRSNCLRLIPPGARFELAAVVRELIANHAERVRMQEAALAFVRANDYAALTKRITALI